MSTSNAVARHSLTAARLLTGAVTFLNLQCALLFLFRPEVYAPAFELAGEPGAASIRGVGLLFVMWNVPYLFAVWNPVRNRTSLLQAWIMQGIGFAGETWIYCTLSPARTVLRESIFRFMIFDGAGWMALSFAVVMIYLNQKLFVPVKRSI